jgi:hypothetical protein
MQNNKTGTDGKIQIIVADKGFVFVGLVFDCDNGWVNISRCMNLRQWGTTKGLGELRDGPTDKTVADPWGLVTTEPIIRVDCTPGAWDDHLMEA